MGDTYSWRGPPTAEREAVLKLLLSWFLLLLSAAPIATGSVSYVVVQDSDQDSLIRISGDGKSVTTIASGAAGVSLAVDRAGNYVVAARSALLRVTRSGVVTTIATAPEGAEWITVAADLQGNLIVADALQPVLWRVSEDGHSVVRFVEYPEALPPGLSEIGLVIDESGDYLLLRIGDDSTPHFYRVTPAGSVSRIPLRGAVSTTTRRFRPVPGVVNAVAGGTLIPDGAGIYLFLDKGCARNVFRLSTTGMVSRFANFSDESCHQGGLARNPETGEIVIMNLGGMLQASADGATTSVLCRDPKIRLPKAVIAESGY